MKKVNQMKIDDLLDISQKELEKDLERIERDHEIWKQKDIRKLLTEKFNKINIIPEDSDYKITSIDTVKDILENSIVAKLQYDPPTDCENFSGLVRHLTTFLYGLNSIGQVYNYAGKHSFNIILTINHGIYVYEPQRKLNQGALWKTKENKSKGKKYRIEKQIIVI